MRAALAIGHSRFIGDRRDEGAVSLGGMTEWEYNRSLGDMIATELMGEGHDVRVWDKYRGRGYTSAMRWLAGDIRRWRADAAIELHFNFAHSAAHGHEWLFWHTSDDALVLASAINAEFMAELPELTQRGIKPTRAHERGASFLRMTHCPAVIAEPFFGSNVIDWQVASQQKHQIAAGIASGICHFFDLME